MNGSFRGGFTPRTERINVDSSIAKESPNYNSTVRGKPKEVSNLWKCFCLPNLFQIMGVVIHVEIKEVVVAGGDTKKSIRGELPVR